MLAFIALKINDYNIRERGERSYRISTVVIRQYLKPLTLIKMREEDQIETQLH